MPVSGQESDCLQSAGLFEAEHDIHVLNRLAGGTLDQVVDDRQHHHSPVAGRAVYRYELQRERPRRPDLSRLRLHD